MRLELFRGLLAPAARLRLDPDTGTAATCSAGFPPAKRIRTIPDVSTNLSTARDSWSWARYFWRVPLLLSHLLLGLPLALLVMLPPWSEWRPRGRERLRDLSVRTWQHTLMRLFGIRVRAYGAPAPGAVLMVANHLSWLDITLLHSQRMMYFVAKSEIAAWPLVGMLAARAGTLFHRRGSSESLGVVQERMIEALQRGDAVGVFPEGSAGRPDAVRVFHARILQPAVATGAPVQPVGLRFTRRGRLALDMAFRPNEKFVPCFFRVLGAAPSTAEVHFLDLLTDHSQGRRAMANAARAAIVAALGFQQGDPAEVDATTLDGVQV